MSEVLDTEIRTLQSIYWSERDPDGLAFAPLADAFLQKGDVRAAFEMVTDGTSRHPDYATGHVVAAKLYHSQGMAGEAELAARRVLELDPGNLIALSTLSTLVDASGSVEEAAGLREALVAVDPGSDEAREVAHLVTTDTDEAHGAFDDSAAGIEPYPSEAATVEHLPAITPDMAPPFDGDVDALLPDPVVEFGALEEMADVGEAVSEPVPGLETEFTHFGEMADPEDVSAQEVDAVVEAIDLSALAPDPEVEFTDLSELAPDEPVMDLGALAPDEPAGEPIDLDALAPDPEAGFMDLDALAPDAPMEEAMDLAALAPDEPVMELGALAPDEPVMDLGALAPDEPVMDLGALAPDEPVMDLATLAPDEPVMDLGALAPDEPVMDLGALAPDEPVMDLGALAPDEPVMELGALAPDEPVMELGALAPDAPMDEAMELGALAPDAPMDEAMDLAALAPDEPVMELGALAPDLPLHGGEVTPRAQESDAMAGDEPVHTRTLAELYVKQGFRDKALAVYRGLLEVEPDSEDLRAKIAELEGGAADADSIAADSEEEVEAMARDLAQAGAAGDDVDTPFAWAPDESADADRGDIGRYFDSMLDWKKGD